MAKKFADLTAQQRSNFEAELTRLGVAPANAAPAVQLSGSQPVASALKEHPITIRDLAHLKEIGGVPDNRYSEAGHSDAHISYPEELPKDRVRRLTGLASKPEALRSALTSEDQSSLDEASRAFVNGLSTKVPQSAVDMINATRFPMKATVVTAQDIDITGPTVYGANGPQVVVAGTITIHPGGSIVCQNNVKISAQCITKLS
jgi:hypothetical protein